MADFFYDGEVVSSSTRRHLENSALVLRHLRGDIIVQRLVCDTPMHRLIEPRHFMDKSLFLKTLDDYMMTMGWRQGDLYSPDQIPQFSV